MLIVLAAAARSAIADETFQYQWGVFACESEFRLDDAEALGRELDTVRIGLATATGLVFPESPVQVTLYATRKRYTTFISLETADARRQRGVFLQRDGLAQVYSFQQPKLIATLRHESTHALLHSALPYVPLWLDEGLATYFEESAAEEEPTAHPHFKKLRWSLRVGWRPNLTTLESRKDSTELDAGDYRHAWGWVCFLLHESDESRAALQTYLRNIADGAPPQTLSAYLTMQMPDARERCVRFLSRW